ncbi:MAG TPA: hypothetical protein VF139_03165 [Candidatus Polarisedimenticolaceae bacterium]
MRTTIEMRKDHRARLLDLAARKGEKGFSGLVAEALEAYLDAEAEKAERRKRALALRGSLSAKDADALREAVSRIRESWR